MKIKNITDSDRVLRKHGQLIFVQPGETIEVQSGGLIFDKRAFEVVDTEKKKEKQEKANKQKEVEE
jgi:hypothetical protein